MLKQFGPLLCLSFLSTGGCRSATHPPASLPPSSAGTNPAPSEPAGEASVFAGQIRRARADIAADNGALWGVSLREVPFLGVSEARRMYASEDPHVPGFEVDAAGLWEGDIPKGLPVAQTATAWAGRTWAMVELPLDHVSPDPTRILAHEAFHVLSKEILGNRGNDSAKAGASLLDEARGRVWFRLELRALARAAEAENDPMAQKQAARDAMVFRRKLDSLATNDERQRERTLDATEGMAEYTGITLAHASSTMVAKGIREVEAGHTSFVRFFPYVRGPEYGRLLDAYAKGWREEVRRGADLEDLLRQAVGDDGDPDEVAARYGAPALQAAESEREASHLRKVAELTARFITGPTVTLRQKRAEISFDPGGQTQLGSAGTVMLGFEWKGRDGAVLTARAGALVGPMYNEFRVPLGTAQLPSGVLTAPLDLQGDGWTLHLPPGWRVGTDGSSRTLELAE